MKILKSLICIILLGLLASCENLSNGVFGNTSDVISIIVSAEESEVVVGGSLQLTATVEPNDAVYPYYNWSSSDVNIAEVDSNGLVTANNVGRVTIYANSVDNTVSGTLDLIIVPFIDHGDQVMEVILGLESLELSKGEVFKIHHVVEPVSVTDYVMEWSSSNTDIVVVDHEGYIEAYSEGSAEITLTIGELSDTCYIDVIDPIIRVMAPDFSKNSGVYHSDIDIELSSGTEGATIYYTTDGSDPNEESEVYTGVITLSGNGTYITVKAVAYKDGMMNSSISSQEYEIVNQTLEPVVYSPLAGTYSGPQNITLLNSNPEATIYYTLDGSYPDTSSNIYTGEIVVDDVTTIRSFAVNENYNASNTSTAYYTISSAVVNPVQFYPPGDYYNSDQLVTLTTETDGATIYYTIDGSNPTTESDVYTDIIDVSGHGAYQTIKAIAVKEGFVTSSVTYATYRVNYESAQTPEFNNWSRTISEDFMLEITSDTAGSDIYYTTDNTIPTLENGILYTGAIPINEDGTVYQIKAIAYLEGMLVSSYSSINLTLTYPTVYSVVDSFVEGSVTNYPSNDVDVILTTATEGADIYYTLDGSDPTVDSILYTDPIEVHGDTTVVSIRAIAVKDKMRPSGIMSETYTVTYPTVSNPSYSLLEHVDSHYSYGYYGDIQVVISSSTEDVTIYYTMDGSDPTVDSYVYTNPIGIYEDGTSLTIKSIALKDGYRDSDIRSQTFTIYYPYVSYTSFTLVEDVNSDYYGYYSDIDVVLTTTTEGASIYYTTDGSSATVDSTLYTEPIAVHGDGTNISIHTIVIKDGMKSRSTDRTFKINYPRLSTPTFSITDQHIEKNTVIEFNSTDTDITFHYTTDGTDPTSDSDTATSYTVTEDVTLKLITVKDGYKNSYVRTDTYSVADIGTGINHENINVSQYISGSTTFRRSENQTKYYDINASSGYWDFDRNSIQWFIDETEIFDDDDRYYHRIYIEMDNELLTVGQHELRCNYIDNNGYPHTAFLVFYVLD